MDFKSFGKSTKKVEGRNFDIRKTLLKFDDVLMIKKKTIFDQRLELMESNDISKVAKDMQYDVVDEIVEKYAPEKSFIDEWKVDELANDMKSFFAIQIDTNQLFENKQLTQSELKDSIYLLIDKKSEERNSKHPKDLVNSLERMVMLKILDDKWKDHINNLEQLRSTIGLRGYGQRDPLSEYKNEAFGLFEILINNLKSDVARTFSRMAIKENIRNSDQDQNNFKEQKSSK